jgi:hypothetical protein
MALSPLTKAFWGQVNIRGPVLREELGACWIWEGRRSRGGYGLFRYRWFQRPLAQRGRSSHRASWAECFGPIPPGLCVLHKCDNPPCVNPAHLFLGTHADNMRDMWAKGRGRGGRGPAPLAVAA